MTPAFSIKSSFVPGKLVRRSDALETCYSRAMVSAALVSTRHLYDLQAETCPSEILHFASRILQLHPWLTITERQPGHPRLETDSENVNTKYRF